jgi:enediyne biosynthesis protein E4
VLFAACAFFLTCPIVQAIDSPPTILLQPKSQSASLGAVVMFRVTASSSGPAVFEWRQNQALLFGATNSTLVLTNVQRSDAGDYAVIVSNNFGGVTSQVATLTIDATFTKITTGSVVNDHGDSTGAAWGDYDGDRNLDLFVSNFGTPANFLYRNNGDGTFTRLTAGDVGTGGRNAEGSIWGDYDNDGNLDLFVAVGLSGNDLLYHNNGNGTFTSVKTSSVVTSGGSSRGCAWGDYNNDGYIDLFVANEKGQNNFLFLNNGDGTFTRIISGKIVTDGGNSTGCAWGDYDNDGFLDLFVANNGENNFLYHNNRDGTFTKVASGRIVTDGGSSLGAAWGDYDDDGFLDLFVANANQKNFLYRNNGDGTFAKIADGPIVNDVGYSWGAGWADYDNDGFLDLFVANGPPAGPGQNDFLYHNNGDGTFTKITTGSLVNDAAIGDGCAWGDFNNDGFLDLFVTNLNDQNNLLYQNNGNSNDWLAVQCVGRASNRAGIGAKVRLKATFAGKSRWQMREISGGSGYASQNALAAHFGLGDAATIDFVRVEWPSGVVQELKNVKPNQRLTIIEPAHIETPSRLANGDLQFMIRGAKDLNYIVESSPNLIQWSLVALVTNLQTAIVVPKHLSASHCFYRAVEIAR